jgi:hypothetical protein
MVVHPGARAHHAAQDRATADGPAMRARRPRSQRADREQGNQLRFRNSRGDRRTLEPSGRSCYPDSGNKLPSIFIPFMGIPFTGRMLPYFGRSHAALDRSLVEPLAPGDRRGALTLANATQPGFFPGQSAKSECVPGGFIVRTCGGLAVSIRWFLHGSRPLAARPESSTISA